jgi:hypothetical protein
MATITARENSEDVSPLRRPDGCECHRVQGAHTLEIAQEIG